MAKLQRGHFAIELQGVLQVSYQSYGTLMSASKLWKGNGLERKTVSKSQCNTRAPDARSALSTVGRRFIKMPN